jgi:hypothetical protein
MSLKTSRLDHPEGLTSGFFAVTMDLERIRQFMPILNKSELQTFYIAILAARAMMSQ